MGSFLREMPRRTLDKRRLLISKSTRRQKYPVIIRILNKYKCSTESHLVELQRGGKLSTLSKSISSIGSQSYQTAVQKHVNITSSCELANNFRKSTPFKRVYCHSLRVHAVAAMKSARVVKSQKALPRRVSHGRSKTVQSPSQAIIMFKYNCLLSGHF